MTDAEVLFLLLVGHALTDFPLQGDFLAKAKNHRTPIESVPWRYALLVHALISAAPVWLITRSSWMTVVEFGFHARVDYEKNDGSFGEGRRAFMVDQWIHIGMKVLFAYAYAVTR